jgi:hypothetical protein
MTSYSNHDDRTALGVDHDEHGCTILKISPPLSSENALAYVYGIPSTQLPAVLFDMTGGPATPEEHAAAEDFLRDPLVAGGTVEDHISSIRNTILALRIRLDREAEIVEAEVLDEYETMDPDELRAEVRNLSTANRKLIDGRDAVLNKLNATQRELTEVRKVLLAIHGAIAKVAGEEAQGNAS